MAPMRGGASAPARAQPGGEAIVPDPCVSCAGLRLGARGCGNGCGEIGRSHGRIAVTAGRHLAVWIASIVFFILGAIWYSVMQAPWLAGIGKSTSEIAAAHGTSPMPYVVGFLAILVMCYTLAWLMQRLHAASLLAGLRLGAIVAIGFIAATLALNYGFEARSVTLWVINSVYVVVGLALAGAIIGGWKRAPKRDEMLDATK
jgi:small-conductance mechanosensitive channel